MSRGLTYADLTAAEQLQYTMIVRHIHATSTGGGEGSDPLPAHAHTSAASAVHTPPPPPSGPRHVWAAVQGVYAYGKRWLAWSRRQPSAPTDVAQLAHFIMRLPSRLECGRIRSLGPFDACIDDCASRRRHKCRL